MMIKMVIVDNFDHDDCAKDTDEDVDNYSFDCFDDTHYD